MEGSVWKRIKFQDGLYNGIGIANGYIPAALTFGLLAKSASLSLMETMSLSIFVYAGASQYMALNLIVIGTGTFEIVLTTFILNLRHFLMSAALNEKAEAEDEAVWKKAMYAFGITDEVFSVAAMRGGSINAAYMTGLILISYISWVISSGVGYIAGNVLPQVVQESMGFALYAMFIGLLVPLLKTSTKAVLLASTAALLNGILNYFHTLSSGWAIIASTLMAAVSIEAADQMRQKGRRV